MWILTDSSGGSTLAYSVASADMPVPVPCLRLRLCATPVPLQRVSATCSTKSMPCARRRRIEPRERRSWASSVCETVFLNKGDGRNEGIPQHPTVYLTVSSQFSDSLHPVTILWKLTVESMGMTTEGAGVGCDQDVQQNGSAPFIMIFDVDITTITFLAK